MRKRLRASFTIEAAVIVPIIMFVFVVLLNILLYYHDKNILMSVAHETASMGSERGQIDEQDLEEYFEKRIQGKLLTFSKVKKDIQLEEDCVSIACTAIKGPMTIKVDYKMNRTWPEDYIRAVRKLEKIGDKIGE